MILKCKTSDVSSASVKTERAYLPRVSDVAFDALELGHESGDVDIDFLAIDKESE